MKRKRKINIYIIIIALTCLALGCQKEEQKDANGTYIYYVNNIGTALEKEEYKIKSGTPKQKVAAVLEGLQQAPDVPEHKSVFPENLVIEKQELREDKLDLHFSTRYKEMEKSEEVLFRAALVQSLVQIEQVVYVDFFIGEEPLADSAGNPVGYMRAEDFVKNTGSSLHTYQVAKLQLYFANKKGDKLEKEEVSLRYNSNMSIEKLIIDQLIKGSSAQEMQSTIPSETKVLGVSVKDNICYVNFDESFLAASYTVDPKVIIYSIVNSLIDARNASQVQISINGETDVKFQESIDLSKPLSSNLDLVEEKEN